MDNYILDIIFSMGSVVENGLMFRHKDRYFLEQIQTVCGNIYLRTKE